MKETITGGVIGILAGFALWYVILEFAPEDFTDTGVGCVDDCLDPAEGEPSIEDEAQVWVA